MTYIPSLIKRIDNFCILADSMMRLKSLAAPETWTMPDDPEDEEPSQTLSGDEDLGLASEIESVAEEISGEADDISNELRLIAVLYRKSLEINGGYNQLAKAISIALANIDTLIDESDGVIGENVRDAAEDILEKTAADLRKRAKSSISQQADEVQAMNALRSAKQNFNQQEARQEMESQKSVYEKGKPGAETGHGITTKLVPETPEKYAREINSLRASYETETDPKNKEDIAKLAQVLANLISTIKTIKTLQDELKVTPDDEEKVTQFNEATLHLEDLRNQRQSLKRSLNEFLFRKEQAELSRQLMATRNPKEQEWLKEKIELLKLRADPKLLRKRDEIKARKTKINAMGVLDEHGDFQSLTIPENERNILDNAIQLGNTKTLSKINYDRIQTEERARTHGKIGPIVERQKGRVGGGRLGEKINQYDIETATFEGLIDKLSEKVDTAAHVARLNVTQYTQTVNNKKVKLHNELKPLVKAIGDTIQNARKIREKLKTEINEVKKQQLQQAWTKENQSRYDAIKKLNEAIKSDLARWAEREVPAKGLEKNVRWIPHFIKAKDALIEIASWKVGNEWQLTDKQNDKIAQTIISVSRLLERYNLFYGMGTRKRGITPLEISLDSAAQYIKLVISVLKKETLNTQTNNPQNLN